MADAQKKKPGQGIEEALGQAGNTIRKVTGPFGSVMNWMDKAGRWAFGEPKKKRQKRLEQAGTSKGGQ